MKFDALELSFFGCWKRTLKEEKRVTKRSMMNMRNSIKHPSTSPYILLVAPLKEKKRKLQGGPNNVVDEAGSVSCRASG